MLPFFAEAIRLRYPAGQAPTAASGVTLLPVNEADGWLADQTTWKTGLTTIAPYAEYPANKLQAGWLLNESVAAAYRSFSTYDSPAQLTFVDAPVKPWPWGALPGSQTPSTLKLQLDLIGLAGWTKIELLNYATPVLALAPAAAQGNTLVLDVPIPRPGVYGFSALITGADGVTQRTSNLLAFTAVPEPDPTGLLATIPAAIWLWRQRPAVATLPCGAA
jgi:hypothetical protein